MKLNKRDLEIVLIWFKACRFRLQSDCADCEMKDACEEVRIKLFNKKFSEDEWKTW